MALPLFLVFYWLATRQHVDNAVPAPDRPASSPDFRRARFAVIRQIGNYLDMTLSLVSTLSSNAGAPSAGIVT